MYALVTVKDGGFKTQLPLREKLSGIMYHHFFIQK
jgi:hypothetical protein